MERPPSPTKGNIMIRETSPEIISLVLIPEQVKQQNTYTVEIVWKFLSSNLPVLLNRLFQVCLKQWQTLYGHLQGAELQHF